MSKIGRKAINIGNAKIEIRGQDVHYTGAKSAGVHPLPNELRAQLEGNMLLLVPAEEAKGSRDLNRVWGLNRACLANKLAGANELFARKIQIIGLGFKAALTGTKIVFSLGYSHKIDYELPEGVSLEIDKTGQNLVFKSFNRELVGHVCSQIRAFRPPEPYKGTGIKLDTEVINRKAGKTKSA